MTEDLEKTTEVLAAAAPYFDGDETLESVLVTEDGKVFPDTAQGRKDAANYLNRRPEVTITEEEITLAVAVVERDDIGEE
jgi:hypothetical protein